jgi:hypothetical protein
MTPTIINTLTGQPIPIHRAFMCDHCHTKTYAIHSPEDGDAVLCSDCLSLATEIPNLECEDTATLQTVFSDERLPAWVRKMAQVAGRSRKRRAQGNIQSALILEGIFDKLYESHQTCLNW